MNSGDDVATFASGGDHKAPPEDPPFSRRFLDPELASSRPLYFKVVGGTVFLILTYVIWGVLPIYWASVFKLSEHAHNLHGWIVVSIGQSPPFVSDLKSVAASRITTAGQWARQWRKRLLVTPVQIRG